MQMQVLIQTFRLIQTWKYLESELATESLPKLHRCSVSLKRPQLSPLPRFIPTKYPTLTRHILSRCVLNRLPFTCWSATCQLGHLECLQASTIFFLPLFWRLGRVKSARRVQASIHHWDTLTREQFPAEELAPATTSCLSEVIFVLLCLVYLFNKRSQHRRNVRKVWETSDAIWYQCSPQGAWKEKDENLSETSRRDRGASTPCWNMEKSTTFFKGVLGVSFTEQPTHML